MKTTILVVEDESIVALNLQRTLTRLGYEVPAIASSHDQAIAGVASHQPDIVLMDINLSGEKDGIDAAQKIGTPVIYLTAYSEDATLERARATKPYGYLVKPFSDRELHATIQMALERRRLEQNLSAREQSLAQAYANLEQLQIELEREAAVCYRERNHLQVTLNSIGVAVMTTDDQARVTMMNPVAETMTGWAFSDSKGQPISKILTLVDESGHVPTLSPVDQVIHGKAPARESSYSVLIGRAGSVYAVEHSIAPILDRNSTIMGSVVVFHDVSDSRRQISEMTYHATHDALTGSINRREFERRLERVIEQAFEFGSEHVMAYLDLDNFKTVNDACGHEAGDHLLRQLTDRIGSALRTNDTLARLGGDEFGVLLEGCPLHVAIPIAENLNRLVAGFRFGWDGSDFSVGVSIGLAKIARQDGERPSARDLITNADAACYQAKKNGKNRIEMFDAGLATSGHASARDDWRKRIQRAIDNNEFVLYGQPIEMTTSGDSAPKHIEVFLRLMDESGRVMPPVEFLPISERLGLMDEVDRWVFKHAFRFCERLADPDQWIFSINLAWGTLRDHNSVTVIQNLLRSTSIPPGVFRFEVSESPAIANLVGSGTFLGELKDMGCRFALDDVGSNISSFTFFKRLPIEMVKISGALVTGVATDSVSRAQVKAINEIAHAMGLTTVAICVESEAVASVLREIGVDGMQGNLFGAPRPLKEVLKLK